MNSQFNQFGGMFIPEAFGSEETRRENFVGFANNNLGTDDFSLLSGFDEQRLSQYQSALIDTHRAKQDIEDLLFMDSGSIQKKLHSTPRKLDYFAEFEQSLQDGKDQDMLFQDNNNSSQMAFPLEENVFINTRMPQQQYYQQQQIPSQIRPTVKNVQQPLHSYATAKQGGSAFEEQQKLLARLAANPNSSNNSSPRNALNPKPHTYVRPRMQAIPKHNSIIYQVQFKLEFRYFLCHPHFLTDADIQMNQFVMVEGEKGEDLGVVVGTMSLQQYTDKRNRERHLPQFQDEDRTMRFILRVANNWLDCSQLPQKYHDEKIVVEHTSEVVRHILNLPLQIVAAEYQFDRTKLFVYYTANTRVDFRELVSKLYAIFKTCIWLKKLHPAQEFDAKRHAAIGLRTGVMPPIDNMDMMY